MISFMLTSMSCNVVSSFIKKYYLNAICIEEMLQKKRKWRKRVEKKSVGKGREEESKERNGSQYSNLYILKYWICILFYLFFINHTI